MIFSVLVELLRLSEDISQSKKLNNSKKLKQKNTKLKQLSPSKRLDFKSFS
jgi:hypothetical protein